ncbi:hypothetical protein JAAARDRAFT_256488 [Jaapia argillacea MUCL 33604]|uniref:Uncharacterized protein n=1 Tax=Jaapia argillacea MUCL 33604 TaxID=933084 RepID=A0A067PW33_9AGAM|nr:hypothetical protein JAAARDRAFT_256488 [Jaapia argillacea MUCL 33604]
MEVKKEALGCRSLMAMQDPKTAPKIGSVPRFLASVTSFILTIMVPSTLFLRRHMLASDNPPIHNIKLYIRLIPSCCVNLLHLERPPLIWENLGSFPPESTAVVDTCNLPVSLCILNFSSKNRQDCRLYEAITWCP